MNDFHLALTLISNTFKASLKVIPHPKFVYVHCHFIAAHGDAPPVL